MTRLAYHAYHLLRFATCIKSYVASYQVTSMLKLFYTIPALFSTAESNIATTIFVTLPFATAHAPSFGEAVHLVVNLGRSDQLPALVFSQGREHFSNLYSTLYSKKRTNRFELPRAGRCAVPMPWA